MSCLIHLLDRQSEKPCLPAVKEGQRSKAGPLVEVRSPACNSPYQGTCAVLELALVEEDGRPGADGRVHAELL